MHVMVTSLLRLLVLPSKVNCPRSSSQIRFCYSFLFALKTSWFFYGNWCVFLQWGSRFNCFFPVYSSMDKGSKLLHCRRLEAMVCKWPSGRVIITLHINVLNRVVGSSIFICLHLFFAFLILLIFHLFICALI